MVEDVDEHPCGDGAGVAGDHVRQAAELRLHRALVGVPGDAPGAREHLVGDVVVELEADPRPARVREERSTARPAAGSRRRRAARRGRAGPAARRRREHRQPGGQQHAGVVAGEEGERGEQARTRAPRAAPARASRTKSAADCSRRAKRVGGRPSSRSGRTWRWWRGRACPEGQAGVAAAAQERRPQRQGADGGGGGQQPGGAEEVPHHEPRQGQRDLVDRADHAVVRGVESSLLDASRPPAAYWP